MTRRLLVLGLLVFFGCAANPRLAWWSYRRGAEKSLPRATGKSTQRAHTPNNLAIGYSQNATFRKEEGWVLSGGVLDFYENDTPRQTLQCFVLAFENQRYDILYSLLPSAEQQAITQEELRENFEKNHKELSGSVETLKKHLNDPIRITGNSAVLFYEEGSTELLFELDGWRVVSVGAAF